MEFELPRAQATDEWERLVGQQIRALRLRNGTTQLDLAGRANVSLAALKNLEAGRGSGLRTLIRVVRALGREEWLTQIAPAEPSVSPMQLLRERSGNAARTRQRAPRSKAVSS